MDYEIPEWLKAAYDAASEKAHDEGYTKGWADGHKHALTRVTEAVERLGRL
ncbi:hypothetical protein [Streptosporangium sp. OZ121]|uniref:hypothetical protein n=1 Tax=Streptosporangium sp. OZ121 TaxID=3444183 RepID=UPI003F7ADB4F